MWYAAHAAGREEPVAIAAVAIFGDVAALSVMVGDPRFTRLGHARYLLHTFVLGDLAGAGIGHLVAGTVLRETAGNRYFQQLLGYRVCNVRPIVDGEAPGTRGRTAVRRVLMKGAVLGARPGQAPAPAKPSRRRAPARASPRPGARRRAQVGELPYQACWSPQFGQATVVDTAASKTYPHEHVYCAWSSGPPASRTRWASRSRRVWSARRRTGARGTRLARSSTSGASLSTGVR